MLLVRKTIGQFLKLKEPGERVQMRRRRKFRRKQFWSAGVMDVIVSSLVLILSFALLTIIPLHSFCDQPLAVIVKARLAIYKLSLVTKEIDCRLSKQMRYNVKIIIL